MRTGRIICFVSLMFLLVLVGCSKQGEKETSADVKSADAQALAYIKASVEGDDDLFKTLLQPDQSHYEILKEGRHNSPGAFERIGKKYSIYRYNKEPNEHGELYYKVSYYRENHQKYFSDLLRMSKENNQWMIREIDENDMLKNISNPDEFITVHKSSEG
ncbi:hypothetical protein [Paenibacillus sp. OK076]|uniref:hypothetical protein n=1 Tax=Paenibacillus sp. OK076 TaxID=1884379 RepID=UPI0008AD8031|nr:hypothetical protein [Paenibacillus sp. OK076]SEP33330.1 hypothetical protein SAMN05518670_6590 [Paenibacillus sp. OK076]